MPAGGLKDLKDLKVPVYDRSYACARVRAYEVLYKTHQILQTRGATLL
jgi:hypothetical protein